jgi:hypothetical protein
MENENVCVNTDKEIWREDRKDRLDPDNCYSDSVSVTKDNKISIKTGGITISMTAKEWHRVAEK